MGEKKNETTKQDDIMGDMFNNMKETQNMGGNGADNTDIMNIIGDAAMPTQHNIEQQQNKRNKKDYDFLEEESDGDEQEVQQEKKESNEVDLFNLGIGGGGDEEEESDGDMFKDMEKKNETTK